MASQAAEAGRKSLTATSLFSFFLSDYRIQDQYHVIHRIYTQRKDHIQHWIMFADVHNYCMLKNLQSSKKRRISAKRCGGRSLISLMSRYSGSSAQTAIILSSFSPCKNQINTCFSFKKNFLLRIKTFFWISDYLPDQSQA